MWREGIITVCGEIYYYSAKVYEPGSDYGINRGRISKLEVKHNGRIVINYDRGWDIRPSTYEEKMVLQMLLNNFS